MQNDVRLSQKPHLDCSSPFGACCKPAKLARLCRIFLFSFIPRVASISSLWNNGRLLQHAIRSRDQSSALNAGERCMLSISGCIGNVLWCLFMVGSGLTLVWSNVLRSILGTKANILLKIFGIFWEKIGGFLRLERSKEAGISGTRGYLVIVWKFSVNFRPFLPLVGHFKFFFAILGQDFADIAHILTIITVRNFEFLSLPEISVRRCLNASILPKETCKLQEKSFANARMPECVRGGGSAIMAHSACPWESPSGT